MYKKLKQKVGKCKHRLSSYFCISIIFILDEITESEVSIRRQIHKMHGYKIVALSAKPSSAMYHFNKL